ncbi:aminoglycoside phosphotransferase family protein [Calidifontibacter sp. DB0510]|uniref:Aminoglycoside phosphotransferase family protein n=1 Tax=Metallococcus carri TaxID=1656884 RepID=A0A967E917_9MICO|nr:aminoglycoside phosphotransferase family protein [Metallococcus carri]NHN54750.1 aminoglycoside phosphotransferase family protein [Metallococcus carri]
MTGGVSSAVHRLTVARHGARTFVILRQYPGGLGLRAALEREIATLDLVQGSGLPVPRVLAADVNGAATGGAPALLMTRLSGHVDLDPADPQTWLTRMAELAARVHSVDLPASRFRPWADSWIRPRAALRVPTGARDPAVWTAAFEVMGESPPEDEAVFVHGDFLPVNLLWSRRRITGLIDWNGVHRGSRAIDVGHCRRYLATLDAPETAEAFRSLYESIAGVRVDPWWDLYTLLHYNDEQAKWLTRQVAGRRPVDEGGMTARVETVIESTLRRLG